MLDLVLSAMLAGATNGMDTGTLEQELAPAPYVIAIDPADPLPDAVDPAEQSALVLHDGTILHADGTTTCVTASPCAYEAAGLALP